MLICTARRKTLLLTLQLWLVHSTAFYCLTVCSYTWLVHTFEHCLIISDMHGSSYLYSRVTTACVTWQTKKTRRWNDVSSTSSRLDSTRVPAFLSAHSRTVRACADVPACHPLSARTSAPRRRDADVAAGRRRADSLARLVSLARLFSALASRPSHRAARGGAVAPRRAEPTSRASPTSRRDSTSARRPAEGHARG